MYWMDGTFYGTIISAGNAMPQQGTSLKERLLVVPIFKLVWPCAPGNEHVHVFGAHASTFWFPKLEAFYGRALLLRVRKQPLKLNTLGLVYHTSTVCSKHTCLAFRATPDLSCRTESRRLEATAAPKNGLSEFAGARPDTFFDVERLPRVLPF